MLCNLEVKNLAVKRGSDIFKEIIYKLKWTIKFYMRDKI